MKKIFLFLSAVLLLAGCTVQPLEELPAADLSAAEVAQAVLAACGRESDSLEWLDQTLGEEGLTAYLTNYYGLEEHSWSECALCRAGGGEAFELAVLLLEESADGDRVWEGLNAYLTAREGDFTGYAPEQAAIVHNALAVRQGKYAALLLCEEPEQARDAFYAVLGQTPPLDQSTGGNAEIPPDQSQSTEPPPDRSTEEDNTGEESRPEPKPNQTASGSSDAASEPNTGDTSNPSTETTEGDASGEELHPEPNPNQTAPVSPDPTPEPGTEDTSAPSPKPKPAANETVSPVVYPGRVSYVRPGVDDMTLYDTAPILAAWESGSTDGLSGQDQEILGKARQILEQTLKEGMIDYEKEQALYRWLTANVSYDQDHYDLLSSIDPNSFNPYGPLLNGKGVCLGFATAFQLLMDMAGVECITVVGAAYMSQEDHAWNMVRLNESWYCVDATWDLGLSHWRYFNVTSEWMAQTDHQWDYSSVPEATATNGGLPVQVSPPRSHSR